ncbi:MAG: ferrous iron transport protein A [Lachnospiraceae bacterium]|nr:ferrous iron transport protein A [Lachnospiraceae bacterium]
MMPLTLLKEGEPASVRKVGGKEDIRQFLAKLGFVTGASVTVVSATEGNLIVNVKDSRIAIGKDMACRIIV